MKAEERLINEFYTCFQARDWRGMVRAYHADVFFYDPVFGPLEGEEAGKMWEMLLTGATELDLQFGEVVVDGGYASCRWVARYIFSATGRRVVNRGVGRFAFLDGKIIEHQDEWSFWKWSAQALGLPGVLFGWTSVLQRKVRQKARRGLDRFMKK